MKILFWILAILSIPVGLFMSITGYFSHGLDLYSTKIGLVFCILGMFSVVVSILCAVLGIISLRKGHVRKAVLLALAGVVYSVIVLAGILIDEAVDSILLDRDIAVRNEQLYGEDWDSAPAIDGIPEQYQEVLNKFYAVVRDEWPADQLRDLAAITMARHYGNASLDNIGFILMDVNGDGIDELMIGTAAPVEEGGTAIFCMYSDPENPFVNLNSIEGEIYYLHPGETDGTYMAEIGGTDRAWMLGTLEGEAIVDINSQECILDPADRLTLDMIPFSQYK